MCQYCGNTGLCGLFWGAIIIKAWHWGTIFFKAMFKKFRDRRKPPAEKRATG